MKKLVFSALLILLVNIAAQSQNFSYFDNSPYWRMRSTCAFGLPCLAVNEFAHFTDGDTLIDNIAYKKLKTLNVSSFEWQGGDPVNPECNGGDTSLFLNCLIRQENKKVFMRDLAGNESLMYDYALELGDTLPSTVIHPQTDLVVTSVDSIEINGVQHMRFQVEGSANFTLIEGLGTNYGLLESVYPMLECGYTFNCFWENGIPVYLIAENGCNLVLSINKTSKGSSNGKVYPNPFDEFVYLEGVAKPLSVYDLTGRCIPFASTAFGNALQIELLQAGPGVYFLLGELPNGEIQGFRLTKR